ncbi:MAG: hypothetical protein IJA25_04300, partial [Anaerotignum sp.]|nr:hypothetical protein [Anaerotignum sp.]
YIINNYTNMTLNGGTIAVPIHADGINNTGTFTMEGGTMELDYSVGIHNSNAANLNGGTIRMISNDAYNGVPTPEGGNFSAYESVSDSGATLTMGADGSAGTTIIIEEGINYMESDVLYLMHMGIDNSVGCEMIVENGSFEIGSGDGIMNDGELTLNGGEFTVDGGRAIYNYGTFVMNDGQIDIYDGEGMTIDGTSTILAGGSIAIDPTATTTSTGVQALGDITFSGTAVEAAVGTAVKAVSDIAGKSMTLSEGSITADGSAVAVETNFTTVTFNEASMTVKAASSANVYVVAAGGTMIEGYEPADGGDGYFYLAVAAGTPVIEVEDDADFADAIAGLTDGNVQIILMDDVTLSTEYEFGDGEANVGALDINLNGYDLILNGTLFNNTGLYIYDTNGGGSIYSVGGSDTVYELIINNGTLVWEDVTLSLKDGQTGIWTVGELQMNSGSITAPDTANATTTNGVLYQAAAADRTTVEDAVTTTGSLTKVAQASD